MQKVLILCVFFIASLKIEAQECLKFQNAMNRGNSYLGQKNFDAALKEFQTAQTAAKECKLNSGPADEGVKKVFDGIKKQRDDAENAETKALKIQREAENARDSLKKIIEFSKKETKRADSSQAQLIATSQILIISNVDSNLLKTLPENTQKMFEELKNKGIKVSADQSLGNNIKNTTPSSLIDSSSAKASIIKQQLYIEVRKALDSLAIIYSRKAESNNHVPESNGEEIVYAVEAKLSNTILGELNASQLYDSSRSILKTIVSNKQTIPEDLFYTYLRSVLHHSWNLMSKEKLDKSGLILEEASDIISKTNIQSAKIYYGLSGVRNALSRYFQLTRKNAESYPHSINAVDYAKKAVLLNPYNHFYQRSLSTYLRNLVFISDSLISKTDKEGYKALGCEVANNIEFNFPKKGFAIVTVIDCANEEADRLVYTAAYQQALNLLSSTTQRLDEYAKQNPLDKAKYYLLKASVYNKMADISNSNLTNKTDQEKYTGLAFENWIEVIKGGISSQVNFQDVGSVYNKITETFSNLYTIEKQLIIHNSIVKAIESSAIEHIKIPEIAHAYLTSNLTIGEFLNNRSTKKDSAAALDCFSKSINTIENAKLLDYHTGYSESFAQFCKSHSLRVKMYVSQGNYELAKRDYEKMMKIFDLFFRKYRFDFYFNQHLISASKLYGEYLFQKEKYKEAIPVLEFASVEGTKQSTNYLIDIYEDKLAGFADTAKLRIVTTRAGYQSYGMKKFTIPTLFGETKYPFDVYVLDRDPDYPYKGIEDQVEWVKVARGGIISEEVRNSFKNLQELAWKNEVSFKELCAYALGEEDKQKVLAKYTPLKEKISKTTDTKEKETLYSTLYAIYEEDIKKDSAYSEAVVDDAVVCYNQYAEFLLSNKLDKKATPLYKRIIELDRNNLKAKEGLVRIDFNKSKNNIELLGKNDNPEELKLYLGFYLEANEDINAEIIVKKILSLKDNPKTRDEISQVYMLKTLDPNLESLFLSDKNKIKEYRTYYINKDLGNIKSNTAKRLYYFNLIELDMAYIKIDSTDAVKKELSEHYNSLGWYSLLTKNYDKIVYYLNKSRQYDPSSVYPYSNLPHVYLFNNDFEKAKMLYLKYKNRPFDKTAGFPTFKDAFLSDFKEFEKEGIANEYIKEIVRLLNQ